MGKPRSAAQQAALRKAQKASARKRSSGTTTTANALAKQVASQHFPGANKLGLSSIQIRHGLKALQGARPIRQYTHRMVEFHDDLPGARLFKRRYTAFLKKPETLALRGTKAKGSLGQGRRS